MKVIQSTKMLTRLLMAVSISFYLSSSAQTVLNHSFEDWTTLSFFEEPAGYMTTNFQSYLMLGQPNVTKTTDALSGNYALKLETVGNESEIIPGGIFLGTPGPDGIIGGIPYTGHPDQVQIGLRHDLNPGDTGGMMVIFKFQGLPVGTAFFQFYDSVPIYNYWVINIDWIPDMTPDSVMFIFFNTMPDMTLSTGSVVYLDEILMLGTTEQLPNNDFENWTDIISEEPDHWFTSNSFTLFGSGPSIEKSTDHWDGQYSVRLTNQIALGGDTLSFITNGNIGENGPTGGSSLTQNPSKYSFYYKYQPAGNDTALAMGILWRWSPMLGQSTIVDSVMIKLSPQTTWTYQELSFNYNQLPAADTLTIAFAAGNINDYGPGVEFGSILWVDKVEVDYGPIGLKETESKEYRMFPNPVINEICFTGGTDQEVTLEILSPEGKLIKSILYVPGTKVSLDGFSHGYYLYRIISEKIVSTGRFIKIN